MAVRYGTALAIVAIAILLRIWLNPVLHRSGYVIVLAGIFMSAWVGGLGPCLIGQTLILVALVLWYRPQFQIASLLTTRAIVGLFAYYSIGAIVGILSQAWQGARRRALIQAEEVLAQQEQLRATLACMGDGVLVTDAAARITLMNPIAESMTGWTLTESRGQLASEIFSIFEEQAANCDENPVDRVLRDGLVLHQSLRWFHSSRNEHRLPVAFSAAPINDSRGQATGVVVVFRDETDRLRTEQALRDADRRKDEFLATLAHELRNPLAPICAGLELMRLAADDRTAAEEALEMMNRQAKHMGRLIDDLLDVSRIKQGRLELRRSPVDLAEVVRIAVEATQPAFQAAEHHLRVDLPRERLVLLADSNRLVQVVSNLLTNAAKFTPRGGRIELSASAVNGHVQMTVADNGVGIPAEKLSSVFDMFTQLGDTEVSHQGLGIGLTLVKRLVELHGGSVEAESAGWGTGSRFHVRLPVAPSPAAEAAQPPARRTSLTAARRRVLVVDDNSDAATALSLLVRSLGNDVAEAADGVEAIQRAEKYRPHVVLMDIEQPRLGGLDAARQIREAPWGMDITLVATMCGGRDGDRRRTQEAGFDYHLVKPIDHNQLRTLLAANAPV